jgi:hypothetical protein
MYYPDHKKFLSLFDQTKTNEYSLKVCSKVKIKNLYFLFVWHIVHNRKTENWPGVESLKVFQSPKFNMNYINSSYTTNMVVY